MHQFYRSRREWTDAGDDCACPEFLRIGSGEAAKWMLLHFCHNAPGGSRYYLGSYRDRRFHPESFDRINWPGGNLHAPRALLDGGGRHVMFANLNEWRPPDELVAAGWSGCMSLPVALTLAPDGQRVRFAPVAELQALRHEPRERTGVTLAADSAAGMTEAEVALPETSGDALEIELEIEAGSAAACGLKVRCSPDGAEETAIELNAAERAVEIEFGKASLRDDLALALWDARLARPVQSAPLEFDPAQPVTLRVFVDHSVVEVFAGAGAGGLQFERYLTQRIYPTRRDALAVKLFSRGGSALARRLRTWRMQAI